ncbi:hypothetical protein P3T36_005571 [Kitasatospora sp. MAP12-15]|uniref:hypothetical protein n=2 Tax=unclassified Kitasatospora TaxID=2633591 RepID=UPI002473DAF0|nr:hypothetical protein [Kitasatospora sp. MAP12-44]MDH6113092.1 hypothetical protein [Kitasatospora sp. MAP12-44]
MPMSRGTFDHVPVSTLFPQLSAAAVESLERAARIVDAAQPQGAATVWEWKLEHAVFTGPQSRTWVILLLDVVQPTSGSDWLEFQFQVGWTDQGQHEVTASVNVGCWCESDHGTHDVDVLTFAVGDDVSLSRAFEAGAERVAGWLAEPQNADFWRAREDLPARRF